MKQIEEMFGRFIADRPPLKRKWQMRYRYDNGLYSLAFYHYHHLIAIYIEGSGFIHEWYETPTDLRGLNSIRQYMLSDAKGLVFKRMKEGSTQYEVHDANNR